MRMSRSILYTALGTVSCLFYVFLQTETVKLGYEITRTRNVMENCLDRKTSLEYTLSSLESPVSLEKNLFLEKQGFEMAPSCKLVKVGGSPKDMTYDTLESPAKGSIFMRLAWNSLFASRSAEAKTLK